MALEAQKQRLTGKLTQLERDLGFAKFIVGPSKEPVIGSKFVYVYTENNLIRSTLEDIIEKTNSTDKVCIASFSSKRLKQVHKLYPEICLSMGPFEVMKLLLASFGLYRNKVPGNCLQIPIYQYGIKLVTKRFINYIHSIGLKIHVWTINDEDTMQKLIDLGVDGIITDRPKALKDLLSHH